ncbi:DUF998 domain-containing protein [Pyrococcus kukulkanii]|uniref:DUF998 domain-containing protein n=1 Tax=Pyrococcus kukulkanii TaxID=1609559 RepID=UPI000F217D88|nr:MAG: hypothetical protein DRN82_04255 [Thermococci archaeon]
MLELKRLRSGQFIRSLCAKSGILAGLVYWLSVVISISRNPWFSFFKNALSDLGNPKATAPWIYNLGLIISAVFLFAFTISLIVDARNKLQTVGGAYISVSAIFLALIGVFHSGTEPHVFVSTYFFVQFFLGILIYGLGSFSFVKKISITLFILALVGLGIPWPSTALLEAYEIILLMVFAYVNSSKQISHSSEFGVESMRK